MPLYFFDVRDGECLTDTAGTELADVKQARLEAARLAGELLSQNPEAFWDGDEWVVEVRDHTHLVLFAVTIHAQDAPVIHHPAHFPGGATAAEPTPGARAGRGPVPATFGVAGALSLRYNRNA